MANYDKFVGETSIVPEAVAERITREAGSLVRKHAGHARADVSFYDFLRPGTGIFRDQDEPTSFLVEHAVSVYSHNKQFRKKLQGDLGLGYLESYMRHWLSSEIMKRTKSPLVRAWLVELTRFANGEPFEG